MIYNRQKIINTVNRVVTRRRKSAMRADQSLVAKISEISKGVKDQAEVLEKILSSFAL